MAIQFRCPGCKQPIEVDDVHANQSATCPYCRRVITVPPASQLDAQPAPAARPVADHPDNGGFSNAASRSAPPPLIPEPLHVGPTLTYRDQVARTYGNYAIICMSLAFGLMIASMVYSASIFQRMGSQVAASQPMTDPAAMQKISEQMALEHPEISAGLLGAFFFGIVGLVLGIVSVKQTTRENWRGILAVAACGLFVAGYCGIISLAVFLGGMSGM